MKHCSYSASAMSRLCTRSFPSASTILIFLAIILLLPATALASTYYVKTTGSDANSGLSWALAKKTIQAAVNTASSGDEIWVAAGTYQEIVTHKSDVRIFGGFTGTESNLSERDWVNNVTIIDANLTGIAVTVPASAAVTTTIDGFTIRNGKGANGAGIFCDQTALTVANCIIRNNGATSTGGGIYCKGSSLSVADTSFISNTAASNGGGLYVDSSSPSVSGCTFTGNTGSHGAGIHLNKSSATISGSTFETNTASGNGGGVYAAHDTGSTPSITGCTFTGNIGDHGGGVYSYNNTPTVTNNSFSGNTARNHGGGIYTYSAAAAIANNTLTANNANTGSGYGGGIYTVYSSPAIYNNSLAENRAWVGAGIYCQSNSALIHSNTLRANVATNVGGGIDLYQTNGAKCVNNTIADNFSANGGGGIYTYNLTSTVVHNNIVAFNSSGIRVDSTAPTLQYNCVYGNDALPYMGVADPTGTDGNIAVDPELANMSGGDLHIQSYSPCGDAGDGTVVQGGWLDIDGQPRLQSWQVDIGADESDGSVWPSGPPAKTVYVTTTGNDANSGLSWAESKLTIQAAIDTAAAGDDVWVAAGTYVEMITLKKRVGVYGGFNGTETSRSERDWLSNITAIDANLLGTVVTVPIGCLGQTAIDGFTIRNGQATTASSEYGGGLYCVVASVNIANNTFRNNTAKRGAGAYLDWSPSVINSNSFRTGIASQWGGGIVAINTPSTISNNLFVSNSAQSGGAILLERSSSTISGCTFNTNTASSNGGGVYTQHESAPTITGNTFSGNTAGNGGGMYCYNVASTITGNTLTNNISNGQGGGIYLYSLSGIVANNTLTGNIADIGNGNGGGIYGYSVSAAIYANVLTENRAFNGAGMSFTYNSPAIYSNTLRANVATNVGGGLTLNQLNGAKCVNNTIADNFAANGGGGIYTYNLTSTPVHNNIVAFNASGIRVDGSAPTLKNNCVYGNDALAYLGVPDQTGLNGNIAVDPQLASLPGGNLHIQPASPCLDAGDDVVVLVGWLDMDGQVRIAGSHVDIGADESDGTNWPGPPPSNIIRVRTTGNDANDGSTWAKAKKTVQAAINAASTNDEIWVAYGTYVERITLKKRVSVYGGFAGFETLRSQRNWTTYITTINANLTGTVVTTPVGCFGNTVLDGFSIRNGQAGAATSNNGGGLYCVSASLNLANCTFRNNSATDGAGAFLDYSPSVFTGNDFRTCIASRNGGGIYNSNASPTISTMLFENCSAQNGGGIYLIQSSASVSGCTFNTNTASSGGGGMRTQDGSPSITNCTFTGNDGNNGGGIICQSGTPSVSNNTFTSNTSTHGGGIYLYSSSATVWGNTLTGNIAGITNGNGGGIYSYSSSAKIYSNVAAENRAFNGAGIHCLYSSPEVYNNVSRANIATNVGGGLMLNQLNGAKCVNNTIADNFAANGGGGIYSYNMTSTPVHNNIVAFNASGIRVDGSAPTLKYNCVYGNDAHPYMGVADLTGSDGNIAEDPLLANMLGGNLHIQPSSPCRDAGDEAAVMTILKDMDNQDRIQGITVDIGADESNGTNWPGPPAPKVIYVSTSGNDANSGLSWAQAKRTVQAGIDTAEQADEVWVAAGTYAELITLKKRIGVYGGFNGTETLRDERNWLTNETALDGANTGTVVTASPGCFATTALDGFTVKRGKGVAATSNNGGGMYCAISSVTTANNVFEANSATDGGGIYFDYSPSVVTNNTIKSNSASSEGGGIYSSNASPTIQNLHITQNTAQHGGGLAFIESSAAASACTINGNIASNNGGGVYTLSASPSISGCAITGNRAANGGGVYAQSGAPSISGNAVVGNTSTHGAGIYLYSSSATASGNTVVGNAASTSNGNGGGIYSYSSNSTIHTNNVADNRASNGGGIYCQYGQPKLYNNALTANVATNVAGGAGMDLTASNSIFVNNTSAGNSAAAGGGGVYFKSSTVSVVNNIVSFNDSGVLQSGGSLTFKNNDVFGNTAYQYSGMTDPTGTNGNISVDPQLADLPNGNLHIQAASPCLDAGNDDAVLTILYDIDGQDRIQGLRVDIGADESDGTSYPSTSDNIATVKSSYTDGQSMYAGALSVTAAFPDLGMIYVEKTDRSCGIRVLTFDMFVEGEMIAVMGTVQTDVVAGERFIFPDPGWPKHTGGFLVLEPVGINMRGVGGGPLGLQQGIQGAVGMNNIGLLITAWGQVIEVESAVTPTWFKISDGMGGIARVFLPTDMPLPVALNDVVAVTGISSCEIDAGNLSRVIRTRKAGDIVRLYP